jgi:hypothetical protein
MADKPKPAPSNPWAGMASLGRPARKKGGGKRKPRGGGS